MKYTIAIHTNDNIYFHEIESKQDRDQIQDNIRYLLQTKNILEIKHTLYNMTLVSRVDVEEVT